MSFAYTYTTVALATANLDLSTADIRILLVMSGTTADTDRDAIAVSSLGTLDEYDGANYVRKALTGKTVTQDDVTNRAEFGADPVTWTALGAGSRQCVGMVLYQHVTDDDDSLLLAFVDKPSGGVAGFPFDGDDGDFTMTPNAAGLIQIAQLV